MAKIEKIWNSVSIKLDSDDFDSVHPDYAQPWREFLDRIKSLEGVKYYGGTSTWYVPIEHYEKVSEWYSEIMIYRDPNQMELF